MKSYIHAASSKEFLGGIIAPQTFQVRIIILSFERELEDHFSGLLNRNFHVLNTKVIVFACGGLVDVKASVPPSYRDVLLSHTAKTDDELHYSIVTAETFKEYFHNGIYKDLLTFENDIASISTVVLIILESDGSLVELGLYCSQTDYIHKLVVVVDEDVANPDSDSFISLGPLRYIKSNDKASVLYHQFPKKETSYKSDVEDLCATLKTKITSLNHTEKFDIGHIKHINLLIAEIVRITFPILQSEIQICLNLIGINLENYRIKQYLFLLEKTYFIRKVTKSANTYYCPVEPSEKFMTFGKTVTGKFFDGNGVQLLLKQSVINDDDGMALRRRLALQKFNEDYSND